MQGVRCCRALVRTLHLQATSPTCRYLTYTRHLCSHPTVHTPHPTTSSEVQDLAKTKTLPEETDAIAADPKPAEDQGNMNYEYFRSIVSDLTDGAKNKTELQTTKRVPAAGLSLSHLRPSLPVRSGNLATYVKDSPLLTRLVELGVDLSRVDKDEAACNHLLRVDFTSGVQPYLELLLGCGVEQTDLGACLTRNPKLLLEDLDDLQVRVNYLESKKFSKEAIGRILTKNPLFLSKTTKKTDAKLGYLQKTFYLDGSETRQAATAYPKLLTWSRGLITDMRFVLTETCGFTAAELKTMLLSQPKIFTSSRKAVEEKFDLLHNKMGLTHEVICHWPQVFRTRKFIIRDRHLFLTSLGRAQYDPKLPNYVSLKMLVSGRDAEFCANVAKVPVQQFNTFLKSQ